MGAEQLAEQLVDWLRSETELASARGVVVGVSGGIDSAVVGILAQRAFPDTHLALILPIQSELADAEDARLLAERFELKTRQVELEAVYEGFADALGSSHDPDGKPDLALANLKARLRMAALYFFANKYRYLVVGTGNRSELTLGYFTKYGDGGVDLMPLGHLVKGEVRELATVMGVPQRIIDKPPAAGLWRGLTDEIELGFSYEQLEEYLVSGEAETEVRDKIDSRRRANAHKLRTPKLPPPLHAG